MVASPPRRLTAGLMCGVAVHAMQAFAVLTALPKIEKAFDGRGSYGAVLTVYLLASVVGLAEGGRKCDAVGIAPAVRRGATWIAVGLVTAALAPPPHMWVLLLGRAFQGFGAGILTTVVYAIVHTAYPRRDWPHVLALLSAAWAVSGVALPGLLGVLVDAHEWGWRLVFVAVLPLLALTIGWVLPCVPEGREPDAQPAGTARLLDAVGVAVGGGMLLHPLSGVSRGFAILQALVGLTILVPGVIRLLPPGTLSLRPILGAAVGGKFIVCMGFFGSEVFVPLALVEVHGKSATFVGTVVTGATLAWMAAAFVQSRVLKYVGPARCASVGTVMILAGIAGLVLLTNAEVPARFVFFTWGVAAAGMGVVYSTVNDSAMAATAPGREGATGMALGFVDVLGAAAGVGLGQALLDLVPAAGDSPAVGLRAAWGILAVLTVPTLFAASRLGARMETASAEIELAASEP